MGSPALPVVVSPAARSERRLWTLTVTNCGGMVEMPSPPQTGQRFCASASMRVSTWAAVTSAPRAVSGMLASSAVSCSMLVAVKSRSSAIASALALDS